jgi:hypothetical protein
VGGNLDLRGNQLSILPESFGQLRVEGDVDLTDNPLSEVAPVISLTEDQLWDRHVDGVIQQRAEQLPDSNALPGRKVCFERSQCINDVDLLQEDLNDSSLVLKLPPTDGQSHCLTQEDVGGILRTQGNPQDPYTRRRINRESLRQFMNEDPQQCPEWR